MPGEKRKNIFSVEVLSLHNCMFIYSDILRIKAFEIEMIVVLFLNPHVWVNSLFIYLPSYRVEIEIEMIVTFLYLRLTARQSLEYWSMGASSFTR